MQTWPGRPYPLGATLDSAGTNFALFSQVAERVELCLLDDNGKETRVDMPEVDAHVWHVFVPGVGAGQRYGYRVYGPWNPKQGQRCDPSKLLLDPYAKAIDGQIDGDQSLFSYDFKHPEDGVNAAKPFQQDSAKHTMVSVVVDPYFDWGSDKPLRTDYCDTVIYECHVKGMTKLNPAVPEKLRGTYAALAHPTVIDHFKKLGVTAVELMPSQQFVQDTTLVSKGLANYWGYNTIGFFAPHNGYAAYGSRGEQLVEFKTMVKALHAAGIEVIMDVVYNHTAEGNYLGPTLSFRGIDNQAYYRLVENNLAHYFDTTGTGNSLLMSSPAAIQLIVDSLRYWVQEMHVDGFRFDLATTLTRQYGSVDQHSAFLEILHQDPVLSQVKLIAEPWDMGDGGYQVGGFPAPWSEWNGKYRDTVRDFWRGEDATLPEFASRITGSSDLYEYNGRRPTASINFVTAHDGFTLNDLVSYNEKHNQANGEGNRDGESFNRSWNCGDEGPSKNPEVNKLRDRQRRNFLATLLLSQGVPMISEGDEIARTQSGNNNAYCQDNKISWMPWNIDSTQDQLLEFTQKLVKLRKAHRVLHRRSFFGDTESKDALGKGTLPEADWFDITGDVMDEVDWNNKTARSMTVFLNGDAIPEIDQHGNQYVDDSFLLMFNSHYGSLDFTIPGPEYGAVWSLVIDTNDPKASGKKYPAFSTITLEQRSMVVLTRPALNSTSGFKARARKTVVGAIPRLKDLALRVRKAAVLAASQGGVAGAPAGAVTPPTTTAKVTIGVTGAVAELQIDPDGTTTTHTTIEPPIVSDASDAPWLLNIPGQTAEDHLVSRATPLPAPSTLEDPAADAIAQDEEWVAPPAEESAEETVKESVIAPEAAEATAAPKPPQVETAPAPESTTAVAQQVTPIEIDPALAETVPEPQPEFVAQKAPQTPEPVPAVEAEQPAEQPKPKKGKSGKSASS